ARLLVSLFPGRSLCIRVVDPLTLELTSVFAQGVLAPGVSKRPLAIRPSAVKKTKLRHTQGAPRLEITGGYQPILVGTDARGIAIPLVASGGLHGLLNMEYPPGTPRLERLLDADERMLIPLANQLSVALRNKKLAQETLYLRDYQAKLIE